MKSNLWDIQSVTHLRTPEKKARRKSIASILKDAYKKHTRDTLTRQAVKRVLH